MAAEHRVASLVEYAVKIESAQITVGQLFSNKYTYIVPRYQRNYAWENDEVSDILKDLHSSIESKRSGAAKPHFLGGLLMVSEEMPGSAVIRRQVVDGQQRLATLSLLGRTLIDAFKALAEDAPTSGGEANLDKKVEYLTDSYVTFSEMVALEEKSFCRLCLSVADNEFFAALMAGETASPKRESHKRLMAAYKAIGEALQSKLKALGSFESKLEYLLVVEQVLATDWTILELTTKTREQAYMLFQVLNDRGKGLTEGELLRAATLELLEGHGNLQDKAAVLWDEILKRSADVIDNYLRWIYASHTGSRPGGSSLYDDFLGHFFPEYQAVPRIALTATAAQGLVTKISALSEQVATLELLQQGEWPYESDQKTTAWERDRLRLLSKELLHDYCLPLLLAARMLDSRQFSSIVQVLERFFFRYKLVCNGHMAAVATIYHSQSVAIRAGVPEGKYDVDTLREKLRCKLNEGADDGVFRANLKALQYAPRASNKPIRYLLMTLEHYHRWYREGAPGRIPKCRNQERLFDFSNTSIEHIYAQTSTSGASDQDLDKAKHRLGNLTFLGIQDNAAQGNKPFEDKRAVFGASSIDLNREIAEYAQWTITEMSAREDALIQEALTVFVI